MVHVDIANEGKFMFCKWPQIRMERLFCNSLWKNWPASTSSPQWTTTKHWIPPFLSLHYNFRKDFPPLICPVWNPGPLTLFTKGGGKLCLPQLPSCETAFLKNTSGQLEVLNKIILKKKAVLNIISIYIANMRILFYIYSIFLVHSCL